MSNPSFKNPPINGIEFDIAYFAALIETPSITAELSPWTVINNPEIVY